MYSTYTHASTALTTTENFNALDKTPATSYLKACLMRIKSKMEMAMQASARMPQDIRSEMYW